MNHPPSHVRHPTPALAGIPSPLPATADSPDTIPQALSLLDAGRLAEAQAVCQRILQHNHHHAAAIHALALIAQATGQHAAASDLFRQPRGMA